MTRIKDRTIRLDGKVWRNTEFVRCKFKYGGGKLTITGCKFYDPRFVFTGAAGRTILVLRSFDASPGGSKLIDLTFPRKRGKR